ncbi:MAG: hypothetical protein Q8R89_11880, partial [Desulfomicrobium sp.]|nr:hypothetical protein [Desulfomicrobium sp.]
MWGAHAPDFFPYEISARHPEVSRLHAVLEIICAFKLRRDLLFGGHKSQGFFHDFKALLQFRFRRDQR